MRIIIVEANQLGDSLSHNHNVKDKKQIKTESLRGVRPLTFIDSAIRSFRISNIVFTIKYCQSPIRTTDWAALRAYPGLQRMEAPIPEGHNGFSTYGTSMPYFD